MPSTYLALLRRGQLGTRKSPSHSISFCISPGKKRLTRRAKKKQDKGDENASDAEDGYRMPGDNQRLKFCGAREERVERKLGFFFFSFVKDFR